MAKYSVLLVEDDEELRRMYKQIFSSNDFSVFEAEDGQIAITEAISHRPTIILLDLLLPRQGGLHALKILRSQPETKNIPVFIMTALPNQEYQDASRGQVQGYFLKAQVLPKEMVEKVKEYLKDHPTT